MTIAVGDGAGLGLVVRHAAALGLDVDTQVVDKARALIGSSDHKAERIPAMAWQDVPAFYASLSDGGVTNLALRLLILTGVRSAPLTVIEQAKRHARGDGSVGRSRHG